MPASETRIGKHKYKHRWDTPLYSQIFIIRTSIIRGPRLSAVFETKIQYAQIPRIINRGLTVLIEKQILERDKVRENEKK